MTATVTPQTAQSGDTLVWTVHVADTDLGPAVDVIADLSFSANLSIVRWTATRGKGCFVVASGRGLACFLDWMSASAPSADIVVTTTATAPGDYVLIATTGELIPDPKTANNTAEVRATTPAPPPTTSTTTTTTTPTPTPAIRIVRTAVAKNGIVTVKVAITGWTVNTKVVKNAGPSSGYWLIYVDGKRAASSRQPTLGVTKKLTAGRHAIRVQLVREDGTAVVPAVHSKTVTVVVPKRH